MSYTKQNFSDGSILMASQLNAMDTQIKANEEAISSNTEAIAEKPDTDDLTVLRDTVLPVGVIILGDSLPYAFGTWIETDVGLTDTKAWKRTE